MEDRALNLLVYIRRALPDEADNFEYGNRELEMLAWSESTNPVQLMNVLTYLEEKGYLKEVEGWRGAMYRITASGHDYLSAILPPAGERNHGERDE